MKSYMPASPVGILLGYFDPPLADILHLSCVNNFISHKLFIGFSPIYTGRTIGWFPTKKKIEVLKLQTIF